jgi:hypothetical protein
MKIIKSFRMRMTQDRVDLFNELWEYPEFKDINTSTKLVISIFTRYKRLKAELEKTKSKIKSLMPAFD